MTVKPDDLRLFLAIARRLNFGAAARELGLSASAASHAMRRLEAGCGVKLVNRSSRSVSLTEAGRQFAGDIAPAFDRLDEAIDGLNRYRDHPYGTIRINVPASIGPAVITPVLPALVAANPDLRFEIVATDRMVDIVAEGFDAGIRLGHILSPDMVATRIGPVLRFAVVASPDLAERVGLPQSPEELKTKPCIRYRFPSGAVFAWEFEAEGQEKTIDVDGPVALDDQYLMIDAARRGVGFAYVWDYLVAGDLARGSLVRCLDEWCAPLDDLYLYYPNRRHVPTGLKALVAGLKSLRP